MRVDAHVHMLKPGGDRDVFRRNLAAAGLDGALLISLPPPRFFPAGHTLSTAARQHELADWTAPGTQCYGLFWVDPLEEDAVAQVHAAAAAGVHGFKIICDRCYPHDARVLAVCRASAALNKPVLFHSGILWDGKDSSRYNRPAEFEALLEVPGLRFALAHISWPWCDECIAVYGKFQSARGLRVGHHAEMFIDLTPGTPPIYRREALTRLLGADYDVQDNLLFGSDGETSAGYGVAWAQEWIARDTEIYESLRITPAAQARIFGGNALRFLDLTR